MLLLASSFMTIYSRSMFEGSFAEQFPVRNKKKSKRGDPNISNDSLVHALRRDQNVMIGATEAKEMDSILQRTSSFLKSTYMRSLCSVCLCKCYIKRKDRQFTVRKRSIEMYSKACDIRSIISVTLNQRILLGALLTKE